MNAVNPASAFKVDASRGSHNGEVSLQWLNRPADQRYLSLDDLWASKKDFWEGAFQTRMESHEFEFLAPELKDASDMHKLSLGIKQDVGDVVKVHEVVPTSWAFSQLCGLAKLPSKLLRELPTQIGADVINWRMRHAREIETVKTYASPESLYAVTGPEYGRIPDYEIVAAVRELAGSGRGEKNWKVPGVMNWSNMTYDPEAPVTVDSTTIYASDRDVFVFLVDDRNPIEVGKLKDGSPDLMFRGFYSQNSEMGARSAKIAAFYLRGICMNRNLWGVEGFEEITIRHSRNAVSRWMNQARPALNSFANSSDQKLIEGVKFAKEAKVADDQESAMDFLKKRNSTFSIKTAEAILAQGEIEEGEPPRSAWQMAQAITAYARGQLNTDNRLTLELEAGKILDKAANVRTLATAA